jgi:hypothetical protein
VTLTKDHALIQQLRNAILLDADYLNDQADWIKILLAQPTSRAVLKLRLTVVANELRSRAKKLHDVLEASEPKVEAS